MWLRGGTAAKQRERRHRHSEVAGTFASARREEPSGWKKPSPPRLTTEEVARRRQVPGARRGGPRGRRLRGRAAAGDSVTLQREPESSGCWKMHRTMPSNDDVLLPSGLGCVNVYEVHTVPRKGKKKKKKNTMATTHHIGAVCFAGNLAAACSVCQDGSCDALC